jgi:phenylacetate-CoA ligase
MGNWKATKVGINLLVKSLAGWPHRGLVRRSWATSGEEFRHYQEAAFRSIYGFARNRVPFYRERPESYPPLPAHQPQGLEFLATLPVIKKPTLREYNESFWPNPPMRLKKMHTTSGTTGTPIRIQTTLWEKGFSQAAYEEWLLRLCGARRPTTLNLSGFMVPSHNDLYWRDKLFGHAYLSIYSCNRANRDAIIDLFKKVNPQVIFGYASAVYLLAVLLGDACKSGRDKRIGVVTSEVLHPQWRAVIEGNLGKLFNFYSAQEGTHMVMQCTQGKMHINPLAGIIELVDENNQPVNAGELGRILVTGLYRKSMPLIRYELGDMVESTGYSSSCPCGLKWPTIGYIEGRGEDLVKTRDGRRIGYLCFHSTKDLRGIKEAQIIQRDYEDFLVNLVKMETDPVENDYLESSIKSQIEKRLQLKANIAFRYVPSIPRGAHGKFKAVMVDFVKQD